MLHDAESNVDEKNVKKLQQLFDDAEKPLFEGSLLPDGIGGRKNTCMSKRLYIVQKYYKDLHECPVCKGLRYKHHKNLTELDSDVTKNGPPAKMLWYLPIIPRLKKLYANPKDAKLLRWHAEEHKTDGNMRHVADSPQWKNINRDFKKFGFEIRNIRFGLCLDGINPFKSLSSHHSTCPKQPGNDINVYLHPLIDDMIDLWETGVEIYDAYKKERFQLFAMIYCTINDFPAYGNLSGYDTKREKACPVCENGTHFRWLTNCRKTIYIGHRRALHRHHPYRKKENLFDGTSEDRSMPKLMDGYATLSQVPFGYSANIKNLVSMKDLKLLGMKSQDCHVLLTQMIPIAICGLMPPQVRQTITKLCLFFNMIHLKVLDHEKLEELQRDIILIICQLEMYFPPSFFDVMVHLVSHIVEEIKIVGPVFLRYMYPLKRYIGFLKGYVRNQYRPKGSIIQGLEGVGTIVRKDVTPNTKDLEQAHFTVLQNMTCFEPYIQEHMAYLARKNGRREQRWLEAEYKKMFSQWLADKVIGYDINGYTFYTKKQDDKSTVQNSGVTLIATMTDSSRMEITKDSYYGVIEEIWELDYTTVFIPILKCKWVDNTRSGVIVDNDGFTCVNLSTNGYLSDPFILAKQVDQDPLAQRIRRGINRIQDLPVGESVEFNKFGQAVGKWQFLFGKYVHFRLENDDVKKQTLLSCGTKWKPFKTRLRVKFMLKNISSLTKWTHIEPNVWDQFCQNENTTAKNAQAASELSQSSNESKSEVDPLIMVLGPEHGGRTRGVGCDIREDDVPSSVELKSSLNLTTNMVRNESQGQQNESFSPRQDHRRLNLGTTKSIVREEQQGEHNESSSTKPDDVSTSVFKIQCIKEETYGCLYVPSSALAGQQVICATATIYPILGDGMIHF
nr:hypothetical protein [Tanacetum cinerariifolium]